MGMNESAVLAEPAKSAKERLKDILLEAEKLKKEVQAEEDARQKAIAAAAATRSTLTVREFLGMLSPITATINIANERTGGVSLSHAVSQTLRRSGALCKGKSDGGYNLYDIHDLWSALQTASAKIANRYYGRRVVCIEY